MQPTLRCAPAPSNCLLRFLRHQINEASFFTSSTPALSIRDYPSTQSCTKGGILSQARLLSTSRSRRASVESSFLGVEGLDDRLVVTHQSNILGDFIPHKRTQTLHGRSWTTRPASTTSPHSLRRLWKQKGGRIGDSYVRSRDLPPLPGFLDDATGTSLGRSKSGKPGSELKLRCTELDENGNVTTVNGEFKKSELIAKVSTGRYLEFVTC